MATILNFSSHIGFAWVLCYSKWIHRISWPWKHKYSRIVYQEALMTKLWYFTDFGGHFEKKNPTPSCESSQDSLFLSKIFWFLTKNWSRWLSWILFSMTLAFLSHKNTATYTRIVIGIMYSCKWLYWIPWPWKHGYRP